VGLGGCLAVLGIVLAIALCIGAGVFLFSQTFTSSEVYQEALAAA
jgi:hypothetical protein